MDVRFPQRKNPRLRQFDYTSCNSYFVTICTNKKRCLFGSATRLSPFGLIARDCLEAIPMHYPGVTIDQLVVMPNHVHAIVTLDGTGCSLSAAIGGYKSAVAKRIRKSKPKLNVWQTSFHDHVIRNQADYQRIWEYIYTNPARWMDDCFYTPDTGG